MVSKNYDCTVHSFEIMFFFLHNKEKLAIDAKKLTNKDKAANGHIDTQIIKLQYNNF